MSITASLSQNVADDALLGSGLNFTDAVWLIAHIDIESRETWALISKYISEASVTEEVAYDGRLLPIWTARGAMKN